MKPQWVCTCPMPRSLAKSEAWRSASVRAARVAGGTRPMVEGPRRKSQTSGCGPTTSTVVAMSSYLSSRSRNCGARSDGAGAAGGIAFGLMAAAGARLLPGFDLVASWLDLDARLAAGGIVVTGGGGFG